MASTGMGESAVAPRLAAVVPPHPIKVRNLWRDAFSRLIRNRLSMIGLIVTLFFIGVSIVGPVVAPYPYQQQNLRRTNELPSRDYIFGTDDLGRDFFSRILWGARTAMLVATV